MNWIEREKEKCEFLFEKLDLKDIERYSIKSYFESLIKEKENGN